VEGRLGCQLIAIWTLDWGSDVGHEIISDRDDCAESKNASQRVKPCGAFFD